jgi:hypothetical protein
MKTIYSILSAQIRPEVQEKITLGLLLSSEGKVFFNYSHGKLKALKQLLSESSYSILRSTLKNIEQNAMMESEQSGRSEGQPVFASDMMHKLFSEEYINYLSKYNNNVISFSAPKAILVQATQEIFQKLYQQLIDDTIAIVEGVPRINSFDTYKTIHVSQLERHFNIDRELSAPEIPNLIAPVKPDLIGRNKYPVFAKEIDLDQKVNLIEYELGQLYFLRSAFEGPNLESFGFVIANEPEGKSSKNFQIWKQLRENSPFEYVDISECGRILEYAEKHDVKPLIQQNKETVS